MQLPSALPIPSPKNKKIHPQKNSLCFKKWNFLALILKNSYISRNETPYFQALALKFFLKKPALKMFFYIFSKKPLLMFQEKGTPKKFFIFQEVTWKA